MRTMLETMFSRRPTNLAEAFAEIHLGTAAERSVFRRFASDPDACWSDSEIAFGARADLAEVRWALERFAEAGIVETTDEPGCYRWRPELQYVLERAEPPTDARDPVCGMPVAEDAPLRAEDVLGRTERFCSERCLAAFLLWPLVFTRRREADIDVTRTQEPP